VPAALAAVLSIRPALRRLMLATAGSIAAAALLFYLPVIGDVTAAAGRDYGARLPWYGVLTRPIDDLIRPSVRLFVAGVPSRLAVAIGAAFLAGGALVLWRRWERVLLLVLAAPAALG
jgi:hypothetical protein